MTSRVVYSLALGAAAWLCLAGCSFTGGAAAVAAKSASPTAAPTERVHLAAVEPRAFLLDEVVAPGKVELNPNRVSRVLMPLPGRIRRVLVHLGDAVRQGQPVLAVESPDVAAAFAATRQSQAQLAQSRSAANKAQADVTRLRTLYQHHAVARKDVLAAENDVVQSQGAVDQAHASLDAASRRLDILGLKQASPADDLIVRAPLSGKVLEIAVAPGEYRNDTNAPLITIADLSSVWLAADVPEVSIRFISAGEAVHVALGAYPGELFHGRVTRIADTVDPQTRTIKVQAEIPNPQGRLRPEMFGEIHHDHGTRLCPAVPEQAILFRGGRDTVMVESSPGCYREVAVTAGKPQNGFVPVLEGLRPGQRIVVDGAILLRNEVAQ
jgi:membrane fusion protein, heavy metal efflux system